MFVTVQSRNDECFWHVRPLLVVDLSSSLNWPGWLCRGSLCFAVVLVTFHVSAVANESDRVFSPFPSSLCARFESTPRCTNARNLQMCCVVLLHWLRAVVLLRIKVNPPPQTCASKCKYTYICLSCSLILALCCLCFSVTSFSTLRCFWPVRLSLLITIHCQQDHYIYIFFKRRFFWIFMFGCTLHRKPWCSRSIVTLWRTFGWFVGECTEYWALHCLRTAAASGPTLRSVGQTNTFLLVNQGTTLRAAHMCAWFGQANS